MYTITFNAKCVDPKGKVRTSHDFKKGFGYHCCGNCGIDILPFYNKHVRQLIELKMDIDSEISNTETKMMNLNQMK